MRFMMLLKANQDTEVGVMPSEKLLAEMGKYNEEMIKSGVLVDAAGLQASSKGARVKFSGAKRTVTDGPFAEAKELIAGYWMIQVKSRAEAIEWAKRCPHPPRWRGGRDRATPGVRGERLPERPIRGPGAGAEVPRECPLEMMNTATRRRGAPRLPLADRGWSDRSP
jgi:hypothetical protein